MGWLFAVGLRLPRSHSAAVVRAIVPLALGHIVSVALVVLVASYAAVALPHRAVHVAAAAILIAFGVYRLVRARHIRWVGMRVGFWGLTLWGFLMSSAHGAGLMLLPFVTAGSRARRERKGDANADCRGSGARPALLHAAATDGRRAYARLRAHRDGNRTARLHVDRRAFLAHGLGKPRPRVGRRAHPHGRHRPRHLRRHGERPNPSHQGDLGH